MRLDTDAVDGHAGGLQLAHEVDHGRALGTGAVRVVVVDVQLGGGICSPRGAEGDRDEFLTKGVGEDCVSGLGLGLRMLVGRGLTAGPEGTVFVEDLVHHVPVQDAALPVGDERRHVVLDDGRERRRVEPAVADYMKARMSAYIYTPRVCISGTTYPKPGAANATLSSCQLLLYHLDAVQAGDSNTQCVAANKLAVSLGLLDDGLAARETEDAARPLGRVPLHAVTGRDLPEFTVVAEDLDVGRVRQLAVVRG